MRAGQRHGRRIEDPAPDPAAIPLAGDERGQIYISTSISKTYSPPAKRSTA